MTKDKVYDELLLRLENRMGVLDELDIDVTDSCYRWLVVQYYKIMALATGNRFEDIYYVD